MPNLEPGDDEEMLYNNDVEDIDFDTELLSWLYRVVVKVHNDIKSAPGHNCIGNINEINEKFAEEVVPESLFMLIAMSCASGNDNEEGANVEMKMRVLSICQDIVFLASRGRKLTPKHVGLGLAVHQATRSKQLLHLLHSAGHSISYETVLRMDNTFANDVLQKYNENGNVFVPRNFHGNSVASYTRYAVDNIDINEETLSGEATAENTAKGKHWNRVARAHKLGYDALWRVLWPLLLTWAHDNGEPVDESSLEEMARRLANEFSTKSDDLKNLTTHGLLIAQVSQVTELIKKFDAAHQDNPTFYYWRKYMNLVSIFLRFTRALREGDWELYLSSFAEMLPWFAAYDHVNYTRWGVVYLAEMRLLPQTASEVYQGFLRGDFATKETHHTFNQISDDQALEHVNKSGKTAGGLAGITRTDSARDRWCLTYNERAQFRKTLKLCLALEAEKSVITEILGNRECDKMKKMFLG